MPHKLKSFLKDYSGAMRDGNAAIFMGAGMSKDADLADWKELLRPFAAELNLDVEREDLVALAQYYLNSKCGERAFLNKALINEFDKPGAFTEGHRIIARLPIPTIWTTNYDMCIEEAFRAGNKNIDVKWTDAQIGSTRTACEAVLYKMHGELARSDQAVIYKEDYERYWRCHTIFQNTLNTDLLRKKFMFLGFSFSDPNINYVLGHLRSLLEISGDSERQHYAIMRYVRRRRGETEVDFEYRKKKQILQVTDLQRYSIETVLIENFAQIPEILTALERRYLQKNLFVSGNLDSEDFGPTRLRKLWKALAQRLIEADYNLVCGFEPEVSGAVAEGALWKLNRRRQTSEHRLYTPFARRWTNEGEFRDEQRESMISISGFAIFVGGNEDQSERALHDFQIAKKLKSIPIPIACSGLAARRIWELVDAQWEAFYPDAVRDKKFEKLFDRKVFDRLKDPLLSDEKLLDSVFEIIKAVESRTSLLQSEEKALRLFNEFKQRYPELSEEQLQKVMKIGTREVTFDHID